MAVNPYGYVPLTDGGAPRIITGYAMEVISGGQFVTNESGAAGVVSSGADSFVTSDIMFNHTTGSGHFIGIALHDVVSGAPLSVATRGSFIVSYSGDEVCIGGTKVGCNEVDQAIYIGSQVDLRITGEVDSSLSDIGRAWTAGSNDDFIIVDIHG